MELASNLVWLLLTIFVLGTTYLGIRSGKVRLSAASAMTLAMLICILLLPVISMTDDLLEAHQTALPVSAQTWRMASEGASVGLELAALLSACMFLLASLMSDPRNVEERVWGRKKYTSWLTRSLRLRPPPVTL